jgi:hypothetical protein
MIGAGRTDIEIAASQPVAKSRLRRAGGVDRVAICRTPPDGLHVDSLPVDRPLVDGSPAVTPPDCWPPCSVAVHRNADRELGHRNGHGSRQDTTPRALSEHPCAPSARSRRTEG